MQLQTKPVKAARPPTLSPEARGKIAAAQRARWAANGNKTAAPGGGIARAAAKHDEPGRLKAPPAPANGAMQMLSPHKLYPSATNREVIKDEEYQQLVESIREHGILQPLVARPIEEGRCWLEPQAAGDVAVMMRERAGGPPKDVQHYEVGKFDGINWEVRAIVNQGAGEFTVSLSKHANAEAAARQRCQALKEALEQSRPVELDSYAPADAEAHRPEWEIVIGEHRWTAALELGLATIPVVVREMDDREAILAQLVENLRRKGLRPLDEARGYQRMREMGMSVEEIGRELGTKDRELGKSTIYNRLRLLELPDDVKAAVETGQLPASHAELLTHLDDARAQSRLTQQMLAPRTGPDDGTPLPFRDAKTMVKDVEQKLAAEKKWEEETVQYRADGLKVLSLSASTRVFQYGNLKADYVGANDKCDQDKDGRTWKALMTKMGEDGQAMVAHNSYGMSNKVRIVFARKTAEKVLRDGGLISAKAVMISPAEKRQRDEEAVRLAREAKRAKDEMMIGQIVAAVEGREFNASTWGFLAAIVLETAGLRWQVDPLLIRRGITKEPLRNYHQLGKEYAALVGKADGKRIRGLIVELLLWERRDRDDSLLSKAARVFGVKVQTPAKGKK